MTEKKKYKKKYGKATVLDLDYGSLAVQKVTSTRQSDGEEFVSLRVMLGYQGSLGFRQNKDRFNQTIDLPIMSDEQLKAFANALKKSA